MMKPSSDDYPPAQMTAPGAAATLFGLSDTLWLAILVAAACNICLVYNFDFSQDSIADDVMGPGFKADLAEHGSLVRPVVLSLFAVTGLLVAKRSGGVMPCRAGALGLVVVAMFGWDVLSYTWTDSPDFVSRRLGVLVLSAAGAFGMSRLRFSDLRVFLVALSLFNALFGVGYEILIGAFHPFAPGYRFAGPLTPNFQGWNDALLALLAITCLPAQHIRTGVKLALLGIGLVCLVLANSRTSTVSCIVAALFWYAARSAAVGSSERGAVILLVGFVTAAVAVLHGSGLVAVGDVAKVLLGAQRDEGDIESLTGRVFVWQTCLSYIVNHWLFGFGYDGFWTPERILQISSEIQWAIDQAHSAYLEQLLTVGIVGLALYVVTLVLGVIAGVARYRESGSEPALAMATVLVFCSVHGLAESASLNPVTTGTVLMIVTAKLGFVPRTRIG